MVAVTSHSESNRAGLFDFFVIGQIPVELLGCRGRPNLESTASARGFHSAPGAAVSTQHPGPQVTASLSTSQDAAKSTRQIPGIHPEAMNAADWPSAGSTTMRCGCIMIPEGNEVCFWLGWMEKRDRCATSETR